RLRRTRHRLLLRHGAARRTRGLARHGGDGALRFVLRDRCEPRKPLRHHRRAPQVGAPDAGDGARARARAPPFRLLPCRARRHRLSARPRGDAAAADRGRPQGGRGGLCGGADPRLHARGGLLSRGRGRARRAGDRSGDRRAPAGRICRSAETAVRLGAVAQMVVRGATGRRDRAVRQVRHQRAVRQPHRGRSSLNRENEMSVDTKKRLAALREKMRQTGTDLVAVAPGSHMDWLLGFHPHPDERPCLLLVGPEHECFLMPALNAEGSREHTDIEFHMWDDAEGPNAALAGALRAAGAAGAKRVVLDETMRADFALLLLDDLPGAKHAFTGDTLGLLRMRKDAGEYAKLKMNAAIADRAMEAAFAAIRPGMTEAELVQVVKDHFAS